jgi:hypothetical protein
MDGKALFDGAGRLTVAGQRVYDRAALKLPEWWKTPVGEVFGTRPPPKTQAPPPRAPVPAPAKPRPAAVPRREAPPAEGKPAAAEKKPAETKGAGEAYEEPASSQPQERR